MRKFKVNGKIYILKKLVHKDGNDTFKLIPWNKSRYEKRITKLSKKLAKVVKKEEVVKQALYKLELDAINKLEKALIKHKPKARKGCYQIDAGNQSLTVVD